jgi:ribulose-phosphate 3-epimerase
MRGIAIVPAILTTELPEASELLGEVAELSPRVQLDVMDGRLVPEESFLLSDFGSIPDGLKIELHAMVADPRALLTDCERLGIRRLVFHLESFGSLAEAAAFASELIDRGFIPVATCWPTAELTALPDVRYYQLMGVHPGAAGQRLLGDTAQRVARLRTELPPEASIQVDGGVNRSTIVDLARAGARRFIVNTAFWQADDQLTALYELKSLAEGGANGVSARN